MAESPTTEANKKPASLIRTMADRYGVEQGKLLSTLKNTAFKQRGDSEVSNEQMMALMVVANEYKLNPFLKEIYAFPDKNNGIVPVVGVDGWSKIINSHPQFDGMEFNYSDEMVRPDGAQSECFTWVECVMYRKDRNKPTVAREYLDEIYKPPIKKTGNNGPYTVNGPWQTHPKRFSRHKATIQCARLAFGFVGIFDPDEADRIMEATPIYEPDDSKRALPTMSNEEFEKRLPDWSRLTQSGINDPDQIIATVSSKYELNDYQAQRIRALGSTIDGEYTSEQEGDDLDEEA